LVKDELDFAQEKGDKRSTNSASLHRINMTSDYESNDSPNSSDHSDNVTAYDEVAGSPPKKVIYSHGTTSSSQKSWVSLWPCSMYISLSFSVLKKHYALLACNASSHSFLIQFLKLNWKKHPNIFFLDVDLYETCTVESYFHGKKILCFDTKKHVYGVFFIANPFDS
jgi:hypothetical protein